MTTLSITALTYIALSAFIIGFSKTSIGGLGIVAVPLIAFAVPGPESTGLLLPILIVGDIIAVVLYHRTCDWSVVLKIFPITAIGVVLGYLIMDQLPAEIFNPVLGIIIIMMISLGIIVEKKPIPPVGNRIITWVVGICAGVSTMVANAAGPLMGLYLLQQGLPKEKFVGTRCWFFLLLNLYKLPFSSSLGLVSPTSLQINLCTLPLILLGAFIGFKVLKYIQMKFLKRIVRIAAMLAALKLLFG